MKQINSSFGNGGMALAMNEAEFALFLMYIPKILFPTTRDAYPPSSISYRVTVLRKGVGDGQGSAG